MLVAAYSLQHYAEVLVAGTDVARVALVVVQEPDQQLKKKKKKEKQINKKKQKITSGWIHETNSVFNKILCTGTHVNVYYNIWYRWLNPSRTSTVKYFTL